MKGTLFHSCKSDQRILLAFNFRFDYLYFRFVSLSLSPVTDNTLLWLFYTLHFNILTHTPCVSAHGPSSYITLYQPPFLSFLFSSCSVRSISKEEAPLVLREQLHNKPVAVKPVPQAAPDKVSCNIHNRTLKHTWLLFSPFYTHLYICALLCVPFLSAVIGQWWVLWNTGGLCGIWHSGE